MSWHHYGAYKSSSSHGKKTTPPASSNWRYLTEVDAAGPRRLEIMTSTTNAKKDFQLETSDIANIQGFRRSGERSTLTMYYLNDLAAASIKKHGQQKFDTQVPEGRIMSGAAQRDNDARALQEERLREAADPYFIPQGTEEELGRLDYPRLQQLVIRHEGGLLGRPTSRVDAVSRILAAGYSLQKEAAHMAKQRKVDAAAEVKAQAARAAALVAQAAAKVRADAAAVEAEARWVAGAGERQAAVERKQAKLAEIDKQFAEGTLNIPVLTVAELQTILQRKRLDTRGVKAVLRDRLTAAMREQAGLVQRNAEATHSEG